MKRGDYFLSAAENAKSRVIHRVIEGHLTVPQAAMLLGLCDRQIQRLKKKVMNEGDAALVHGNRGRTPAHAIPHSVRSEVAKLALDIYEGTSCVHIAELLEEQKNIKMHGKTVGRILAEAKIELHFHKKPARRRKSRTRMPQEGMLVQIDASQHQWLTVGPMIALHGAIDDATGKILALHFRRNEDLEGYLTTLEQINEKYGSPMSMYSDRHTIFFSPNRDKLTIDDHLKGKQAALSQFGRAIAELGINHVAAYSPQAKGRIERLWGTLQARLRVHLRCSGATTIHEANSLLPAFIEKFNARFAVQPENPVPAFGMKHSRETITKVLCSHETRTATNGSYIAYKGATLQLIDAKGEVVPLRPKSKVTLLVRVNSVRALYDGRIFTLREIEKPEKQVAEPEPKKSSPSPHKTATPWRNWAPAKPRPRKSVAEKYFEDQPSWSDIANSTRPSATW